MRPLLLEARFSADITLGDRMSPGRAGEGSSISCLTVPMTAMGTSIRLSSNEAIAKV
jgi:hypothetical protein